MNSDVRDPSDVISEARATLDAWRARGVDRMDPVRFHFIEALARRAAGHSGEARRILDNRLHSLLTAYATDLEQAAVAEGDVDDTGDAGVEGGRPQLAVRMPSLMPSPVPLPLPVRGALGELLDQIAGRAPSAQSESSAAGRVASQPASWPELEVLEYFREVWSRLGTERQLRQSQQQVPGNAGPLNSSSLVHRSLSLMRELSPGYLQQFLSYVDALSWMEQMNSGGPLPGKDAPRAAGAKKSTRGASR